MNIRLQLGDPILIGGVGGSGTRVVTEILKQSGVFMGSNLNSSNDNLTIGRKFSEIRDIILNNRTVYDSILRKLTKPKTIEPTNVEERIQKILLQFEDMMHSEYIRTNKIHTSWGWKIPANFFILEYLLDIYPNMKYIHIIRNGFDMAYSDNQNQLNNWGMHYGVNAKKGNVHKASFDYWYAANKEAIAQGTELLKDNFLLLKLEDLCYKPNASISRLLRFINCEDTNILDLEKLIKCPTTFGRYKNEDLSPFSKDDYSKLNEIGYSVE